MSSLFSTFCSYTPFPCVRSGVHHHAHFERCVVVNAGISASKHRAAKTAFTLKESPHTCDIMPWVNIIVWPRPGGLRLQCLLYDLGTGARWFVYQLRIWAANHPGEVLLESASYSARASHDKGLRGVFRRRHHQNKLAPDYHCNWWADSNTAAGKAVDLLMPR